MDCPTCGKELATEQGVRIHHAQVHEESLPNRECADCGAAFYDPQSRRTFCDDCDANTGRANGNWRGAKESTNCKRCEAAFEYYPSNKEGVYCPDCVSSADEFLGDAHRKDAERVATECEQCGESMNFLQTDIDRGEGRFCSRA
jgi:RNase P subunit RPR2